MVFFFGNDCINWEVPKLLYTSRLATMKLSNTEERAALSVMCFSFSFSHLFVLCKRKIPCTKLQHAFGKLHK